MSSKKAKAARRALREYLHNHPEEAAKLQQAGTAVDEHGQAHNFRKSLERRIRDRL